MRIWVDPREHELRAGGWVPEAHVYEDHGYALDVHKIGSARGKTFSTREEARDWSIALGQRWIAENL